MFLLGKDIHPNNTAPQSTISCCATYFSVVCKRAGHSLTDGTRAGQHKTYAVKSK